MEIEPKECEKLQFIQVIHSPNGPGIIEERLLLNGPKSNPERYNILTEPCVKIRVRRTSFQFSKELLEIFNSHPFDKLFEREKETSALKSLAQIQIDPNACSVISSPNVWTKGWTYILAPPTDEHTLVNEFKTYPEL